MNQNNIRLAYSLQLIAEGNPTCDGKLRYSCHPVTPECYRPRLGTVVPLEAIPCGRACRDPRSIPPNGSVLSHLRKPNFTDNLTHAPSQRDLEVLSERIETTQQFALDTQLNPTSADGNLIPLILSP